MLAGKASVRTMSDDVSNTGQRTWRCRTVFRPYWQRGFRNVPVPTILYGLYNIGGPDSSPVSRWLPKFA
jgi:hypothetical protein